MVQKQNANIMDGNMTAEELKTIRTELGITQTELAAHLGYYTAGQPNRSVISRWESGKTNINPRIEMLLRDYFKKKEVHCD